MISDSLTNFQTPFAAIDAVYRKNAPNTLFPSVNRLRLICIDKRIHIVPTKKKNSTALLNRKNLEPTPQNEITHSPQVSYNKHRIGRTTLIFSDSGTKKSLIMTL